MTYREYLHRNPYDVVTILDNQEAMEGGSVYQTNCWDAADPSCWVWPDEEYPDVQVVFVAVYRGGELVSSAARVDGQVVRTYKREGL